MQTWIKNEEKWLEQKRQQRFHFRVKMAWLGLFTTGVIAAIVVVW